ncbi:MarR family winged helix-turn-helix transcriptional regulator [uncultured Sphingomonas sp.]|uniref:MarR family winged helix-turn-helix transcriptional regulator n=1 Tax=uncultured Sphingomonas sp. TaxID=158754 RepID=UPI0025EA05A8|nr:MarR family winged helix-turn-helix transcriptional regulator [uncultured Sphingomonas sp.]
MRTTDDLTARIGYQLQVTNLHLMERSRVALAQFGITPARVTAMVLIRENEGCDQSALGRALSINRASAMKLVNALAEVGFVERRSGRDLRSNALHLTPTGRSRLTEMLAALDAVEDAYVGALSSTERATLRDLLDKLRTAGEGV